MDVYGSFDRWLDEWMDGQMDGCVAESLLNLIISCPNDVGDLFKVVVT